MKRPKHLTIFITICLVLGTYLTGASATICSGATDCIHCNFSHTHKSTHKSSGHTDETTCCDSADSVPCNLNSHRIPNIPSEYLSKISDTHQFSWGTNAVSSHVALRFHPVNVLNVNLHHKADLRYFPIYLQTLALLR